MEPPAWAHGDEQIRRAQEWLFANFREDVRFGELAGHVGMSPRKWINTRRLELAYAWIKHGKASLEDVAKILGYLNVRALRTAFWKQYEAGAFKK